MSGEGLSEMTFTQHDPATVEAARQAARENRNYRPNVGKLVRDTWVAWAKTQPDPKPSWLTPWETLDAGQKEVDTLIGLAVVEIVKAYYLESWAEYSRKAREADRKARQASRSRSRYAGGADNYIDGKGEYSHG